MTWDKFKFIKRFNYINLIVPKQAFGRMRLILVIKKKDEKGNQLKKKIRG